MRISSPDRSWVSYHSVQAVLIWHDNAFGGLSPTEILRWVVPGVTCLVLSMQVMLAGFFVDMIRLRLRR
ncbi:hypothetical protein N9023_07595 [Opitutaceae bacterium]|nr:hypothetical protein [Opitutaceae bacterium]